MSAARSRRGRPRIVVVGGGVAGLSAAQAVLELLPDVELHLLERAPRVGGLVETDRSEPGFVIEHGADCIVTAKPEGLRALERTGLSARTVPPTACGRETFVVRDQRLVKMPAGLAFGAPASPLALLRCELLSLRAKLRLALEPYVAKRIALDDESVASFVTRRFGREFLANVVGPVLEGIHGAAADELSMQACLPGLRLHEQQTGSVARAMRGRATPGPMPPVLSLEGGMDVLVRALAETLGSRVRTSTEVRAIVRGQSGGYRVQLADGGGEEVDAVIVASPAHAAVSLVEPLSGALASLLAAVRYSRMDCVTLAFAPGAWPAGLEGSGFVVPRSEARATRASTWSSMKWPGRAPAGFVLTRTMLDGAGMRDDDLREAALRDHAELLGVHAAPHFVKIRRREACLPVPALGCLAHRAQIVREAEELAGFALVGNALGIVGLPDCIESGRAAGRRLALELQERTSQREGRELEATAG